MTNIKNDMNTLRSDTYKDIIKREPLETLRDELRKTQVTASDFFNIDPTSGFAGAAKRVGATVAAGVQQRPRRAAGAAGGLEERQT